MRSMARFEVQRRRFRVGFSTACYRMSGKRGKNDANDAAASIHDVLAFDKAIAVALAFRAGVPTPVGRTLYTLQPRLPRLMIDNL